MKRRSVLRYSWLVLPFIVVATLVFYPLERQPQVEEAQDVLTIKRTDTSVSQNDTLRLPDLTTPKHSESTSVTLDHDRLKEKDQADFEREVAAEYQSKTTFKEELANFQESYKEALNREDFAHAGSLLIHKSCDVVTSNDFRNHPNCLPFLRTHILAEPRVLLDEHLAERYFELETQVALQKKVLALLIEVNPGFYEKQTPCFEYDMEQDPQRKDNLIEACLIRLEAQQRTFSDKLPRGKFWIHYEYLMYHAPHLLQDYEKRLEKKFPGISNRDPIPPL